MKVEEYVNKVQDLIIKAEGKISGIKLAKNENVRMSIASANGNPALIFCKTDDNFNPESIIYCLELTDIPTIRTLQMWLGDALDILTHKQLQEIDMKDTVEKIE